MICIWDKKENKEVDKDECELYIGADGLVYELDAASMGGDTWLSREDVSSRYEIRFHLNSLFDYLRRRG